MTARSFLVAFLLATLPTGQAAAQAALQLETRMADGTLRVALVNLNARPGTRPIRVFTGFQCSGPDSAATDSAPFDFFVDGRLHPSYTCPRENRQPVIQSLGPGQRYEVGLGLDSSDDQGAHQMAVRYRPSFKCPGCWSKPLTSAALLWPSSVALQVTAAANADGTVAVELEHKNVSARGMTVFTGDACANPIFDTLLVDGQAPPREEPAACPGKHPGMQSLDPGASFTTKTTLRLSPGHHAIQATYQTLKSNKFTLMIRGVATDISLGTWSWDGTVHSAPFTIEVR